MKKQNENHNNAQDLSHLSFQVHELGLSFLRLITHNAEVVAHHQPPSLLLVVQSLFNTFGNFLPNKTRAMLNTC